MYMFRIYSTTEDCRQVRIRRYEYAIERINHYKYNWAFYAFATLAYFNGEYWEELEQFD